MWNERYARDAYAYGKEPNDFIRAQETRLPAGSRVLCIAEGEGRNAVFMAGRGHAVTAMDQSSEGMAKARRLAAERGVDIATVRANAEDFDLGREAWDGIVSVFAHMPRALRQDLHRRVVTALAPGGVLLLEAYAPKQLEFRTGGPPDVALTMSVQDLQSELAELNFLLAQEVEREVVEGEFHTGMAAVTQIVATKPRP